jgi:hypothetical protein
MSEDTDVIPVQAQPGSGISANRFSTEIPGFDKKHRYPE